MDHKEEEEAIRIFNKIKNVKNLSHVKVHTPTDIYPTAKDIIGQANSRQDSLLSENGLTKISSNSSDSGITTIQPNKRPFGQSLNSNSQVCNADTYDDDLQSDISDIEFSHIKLLVQAYNLNLTDDNIKNMLSLFEGNSINCNEFIEIIKKTKLLQQ